MRLFSSLRARLSRPRMIHCGSSGPGYRAAMGFGSLLSLALAIYSIVTDQPVGVMYATPVMLLFFGLLELDRLHAVLAILVVQNRDAQTRRQSDGEGYH